MAYLHALHPYDHLTAFVLQRYAVVIQLVSLSCLLVYPVLQLLDFNSGRACQIDNLELAFSLRHKPKTTQPAGILKQK